MASRVWIAAAMALAVGCQNEADPVIASVTPTEGDIAGEVVLTVSGSHLIPRIAYDVDSGEAVGTDALSALLISGSLEVVPLDVHGHVDGHVEMTVPEGVVPGSYDVMLDTGGKRVVATAAYLARGALAVVPDVVALGTSTGSVELRDGSGQIYSGHEWSLSAALLPDEAVTLSSGSLTLDGGVGEIGFSFDYTVAKTVTIDLADIAVDGRSLGAGVTVTPGVWALSPGPAARVALVSTEDTGTNIALPLLVTDQYGNAQPSHSAIDVDWSVTQSFFPSQITPGIDMGTVTIPDGTDTGSVQFNNITERGAAEIEIQPSDGTGCDGVLCLLPFGGCPNPLPATCSCSAPNCL